jgi:hypothetical protein
MDSIKLTKEQKEKLLEMCNVLFPEYNEIVLTKHNTLRFGYKETNVKTWIGNMSIHWFEFCVTNLTTKIFNILKLYLKTDIASYRGRIIQYEEHPVDYLYKEFKKL